MKTIKPNEIIIKALEGKQFHVDSLGRIVIEDPDIMDSITGAFGGSPMDIPNPLWNGACSNSRC